MTATKTPNTPNRVPTIKFIFNLGTPQYELEFQAFYLEEVKDKELVFKLRLYGADKVTPIDTAKLNWSYSNITRSAYAYSTAAGRQTVSQLKHLRSTEPFVRAEIEPIRWTGPGNSPEYIVDDIMASHPYGGSLSGTAPLKQVLVVSCKEMIGA